MYGNITITLTLLLATAVNYAQRTSSEQKLAPIIENSFFALSNKIRPSRYELHLNLKNFGNNYFSGNVAIFFRVQMPIYPSPEERSQGNKITMHADESLKFTSVEYSSTSDKNKVKVLRTERDYRLQTVTFVLSKIVSEGTLHIEFNGRYSNEGGLFYRPDGNSHYIASSFALANARKAFPCFDEPSFKAKFAIKLEHEDNFVAVSNGALKSTDGIVTEFEETDKISTHMVGFVVGRLKKKRTATIQSDDPCPPALDIYYLSSSPISTTAHHVIDDQGLRFIKYLQNKFKSCLFDNYKAVFLPNDGESLTGFDRLGIMLMNNRQHREDSKRFLFTLNVNIVRMLAQHVFGNMITATWWDQFWITEGIASQLTFEFLKDMHNAKIHSIISYISPALNNDHDISPLSPNRIEFNSAEKINRLQHSLRFVKSGALFQQIKNRLGEENFHKLLVKLVSERCFSTVTDRILEDYIKFVSGKYVLGLFGDLICRSGHPVITVSKTGEKSISLKLNNETRKKWVLQGEVVFKDEKGHYEIDEIDIGGDLELSLFDYKLGRIEYNEQVSLDIPTWFDFGTHWFEIEPYRNDILYYHRTIYSNELIDTTLGRSIEHRFILSPEARLRVIEDSLGTRRNCASLLPLYKNRPEEPSLIVLLDSIEQLTEEEKSTLSQMIGENLETWDLDGMKQYADYVGDANNISNKLAPRSSNDWLNDRFTQELMKSHSKAFFLSVIKKKIREGNTYSHKQI